MGTKLSFLLSIFTFFCGDIKLMNYVILQIYIKIASLANKIHFDEEKSRKIASEKSYSSGFLDISMGDVDLVMERLGIKWELKGDERSISEKEFLGMFDLDKEIRVDEMKEAFDVFDQNRDGFIEVMELQRVLYVLGLKEWDQNKCREMIAVFDLNGDGFIDFQEFLIFMDDYCFS